jgi:hypothetical protein
MWDIKELIMISVDECLYIFLNADITIYLEELPSNLCSTNEWLTLLKFLIIKAENT